VSTWTLEHAKAIVAAWPEVEEIDTSGKWHKVGYNLDSPYIGTSALGNPSRFRLPPKKKLVEWTASDVKPGMVFRVDGWAPGTFRVMHEVFGRGIAWSVAAGHMIEWEQLKERWLWSIDASPGSWRPCAKEIEQ